MAAHAARLRCARTLAHVLNPARSPTLFFSRAGPALSIPVRHDYRVAFAWQAVRSCVGIGRLPEESDRLRPGWMPWRSSGSVKLLAPTAKQPNIELRAVTPRRSRPSRGIARSLYIYYGDRPRAAAMDRLYSRFVWPGDLVFDVGAHVGDRVASFRRLGARVVAVEPQPGLAKVLRLLYGRSRTSLSKR